MRRKAQEETEHDPVDVQGCAAARPRYRTWVSGQPPVIDQPANQVQARQSHVRTSVRRTLAVCAALVLVAVAALIGHAVAMQSELDNLRDAAQHRLDMVGAGLEGDLKRLDYLPSLLEMTPSVFALLDTPATRPCATRSIVICKESAQPPARPASMF